jgi:hypothetical protein
LFRVAFDTAGKYHNRKDSPPLGGDCSKSSWPLASVKPEHGSLSEFVPFRVQSDGYLKLTPSAASLHVFQPAYVSVLATVAFLYVGAC